MGGWGYYPPYVSAAQRRANALREVLALARKGVRVSPVKLAGRAIVSMFWGKAWCDNLESYSDFSNRLPRGRSYVRNSSVIDLQIEPGKVTALVSGSSLYRITIHIQPLIPSRWKKLKSQCGTQIGSLVELLQGRLSTSVMEIVTHRDSGLFPAPAEIEMSCSCPDSAAMCKHIAATLYGVGNRLDQEPELLFKLRQVDHLDLITDAGQPIAKLKKTGRKMIAKDHLADVFGIELETPPNEAIDFAPPIKAGRRKKPIPLKEKKANRTTAANEKKSAVSDGSAYAKVLNAKGRNRIAQPLKKGREAQRSSRSGIAGKSAKRNFAGGRSGRQNRSAAP